MERGRWSRQIGTYLLRGQLGFRGVTITDSLDGAAHARGQPSSSLALRAARAGTDLLLLTGSEPSSQRAYRALLSAAADIRIDRGRLLASYRRILALKANLGGPRSVQSAGSQPPGWPLGHPGADGQGR